ncbi:MAG: helix-turn-helix transcriptional regulator [Clostridia bacterium]|nr:helix-turn-helix transcriptional regulator [Clostridia bacterium]
MFWERFTVVCANKNLQPEAIAKLVYASPDAIAKWRAGATPNLETLYKLANKLEVDVDELLCDDCDDLSGKGEFWNGLLKECKKRGTDPYRLAESLSISADAVDLWRDGTTPGSMVISKLAAGLGTGIGDLFCYDKVVGVKDVHEGVMLRHELEKLAELLTENNVKKVIEFAEFILEKQLTEAPDVEDD